LVMSMQSLESSDAGFKKSMSLFWHITLKPVEAL